MHYVFLQFVKACSMAQAVFYFSECVFVKTVLFFGVEWSKSVDVNYSQLIDSVLSSSVF